MRGAGEEAMLLEAYHGPQRSRPLPEDEALARYARAVAGACFPGGHAAEVLHGGHCTIRGAMAPAEALRASPALRGLAWSELRYGGQSVLQGTVIGRKGGSVHVHRLEGGPAGSEENSVSVYFSAGCGRAAARAALEGAGFRDFE